MSSTILRLRTACILLLPIILSTSCKRGVQLGVPADVTADSLLVVHLRGGEVWNNPVVRDLTSGLTQGAGKAFDLEQKFRDEIGVSLADIDTVLFCVQQFPKSGPEFIVVVAAKKPLEKDAVMKSLRQPGDAKQGFIGLFDRLLLHFPDDRTFVVVHEALADRYLGGYAKDKGAWPMSDAIKKASEGHTLAALVNPDKLPAEAREDAKDEPFAPLLAAKSISLVADLKDKELHVGALAAFADAAAAAKSKETASRAVADAGQAIDTLSESLQRSESIGPAMIGVFKEARRALTETKVEVSGSQLTLKGNFKADFEVGPIVQEAVQKVRLAAERAKFTNNLKQIMLGLVNYASAYDDIVLVGGTDSNRRPITDLKGKAILSWRVAILPFIEQQELYNQFKLDEPWDSEHNKKLIPKMPAVYAPMNGFKAPEGQTLIQMIVGPAAMRPGYKMGAIPDGTSNTIAIAEAATPVIWTKPDDIFIPGKEMPKDLKKKFGGQFPGAVTIGLWDGSIRGVNLREMSDVTLWSAICPDDGKVLGSDW